MTPMQLIKLGRLTALLSFLFGTFIFALYFFTSWVEILFVGYGFIVLAGIFNIIILIAIALIIIKNNENRNSLLKTLGLMFLNIPIMLTYCCLTIILLQTMRITFTNDTESEITDIKIVGCSGGHIDKLEKGESKTVWVTITDDCSLFINYLSNGQRKEETVAGYVTSNMGEKITYRINDNM